MIRISIVTICFNNEEDIRQTIESVINQSYKNIEYIVVDGGSSDKTLSIIAEYSDYIDIQLDGPDEGLYDAINKGLKVASGEVVGLIHAGDRLYDDNIILSIADHFKQNEIDGMYGHSVFVNEKGKVVRINKSPAYNRKLVKRGWMPSHQSIYLRRSAIEELGYYRLDLHPSSDYEFFLRYFYFNKLEIKRLDSFVIKFSMGGRSTRNYINNIKAQKQHRECWTVNGVRPPLMLIPMKLLRKPKQFLKAYLKRTLQ